jgi:hypothetical protein
VTSQFRGHGSTQQVHFLDYCHILPEEAKKLEEIRSPGVDDPSKGHDKSGEKGPRGLRL